MACQIATSRSVTDLGPARLVSDDQARSACEPIQRNQLLSLNNAHLSEDYNSRCDSAPPCAPCESVPISQATGKYFQAVCVSGQCSVRDVRQSPITECKDSSDCVLRDGVACCPGCSGEFVSVNSSAVFCPDGAGPCGLCVSPIPDYLIAQCESGRCTMAELLR